MCAFEKDGLDDAVALEIFHATDDGLDVVVGMDGAVELSDVGRGDGVEFDDVVVAEHEGIEHVLPLDLCAVGQDADFCLWEELVAQGDDILHHAQELRMEGGFAVAGKGDDVEGRMAVPHFLKLATESFAYFLTAGEA